MAVLSKDGDCIVFVIDISPLIGGSGVVTAVRREWLGGQSDFAINQKECCR